MASKACAMEWHAARRCEIARARFLFEREGFEIPDHCVSFTDRDGMVWLWTSLDAIPFFVGPVPRPPWRPPWRRQTGRNNRASA